MRNYIMVKFVCADYGFECDFITEGEMDDAISKFAKHTLDKHGIEYSRDVLIQFIRRQKDSLSILSSAYP